MPSIDIPDDFVNSIHPNLKLLSHSGITGQLHRCPRKFELSKLMPPARQDDDEHLLFGSLVGIGTQEYLVTNNLNSAYMAMLLSWKEILDAEEGAKSRKTFWHGLYALDKFSGLRRSSLSNYQLATFDGKPAVELGFSIDLGDGFYYRGFLDALLIDLMRNELVVYEGKTTKFREVHPAIFKHSGQSLGYSLVVDAIAQKLGLGVGSSYKVLYSIWKTFAAEWELMPFTKNHTQRALWIKNLLLDKQRVIEYAYDGFPMYGESCFEFFRPCPFFGTCEMSNKYLIGDDVEVKQEDTDKYTFKFHITELIEAQLAKHEEQE